MHIYINDILEVIPDNITDVEKLVKHKEIPSAGTAIAINGKLAKRENWGITPLKEDDRLMVISATYGG